MAKRSRVIVIFVAVLGVATVAVGWKVRSIQAKALLVAQTGQDAIRLLNDYRDGLAERDPARAAALYDAAGAAGSEVFDGVEEKLELARDGVRVFGWKAAPAGAALPQIERLLAGIQSFEYVKFKLRLVEEAADAEAVVLAIMWLRGVDAAEQDFETFARYRMWLAKADGDWKISRQALLAGETVTGSGNGFEDVTAAAGVTMTSHMNPDWTTPEWYPNLYEMMKYGSPGAATADYDNDGWYDIFLGDGLSPRLYRNNGDGTFADVTEAAGLPLDLVGGHVGLFADFDNDGDKDLYVGRTTRSNLLYRNNGDGTFTDVSESIPFGDILVHAASITDYDEDGNLDLYIGRYLDPRINNPGTVFYTRNGQGNTLLRNNGDLTFADVTEAAGVREGGLTLGIAWGDYDADGDEDTYVVNDYGRNVLYRNNGDGTFTDVARESGTLDFGYGMSSTFGDIDNDGDLDIYTSNLHSGQRWYGQSTTINQYVVTSLRQGTFFQDLPLYREIVDLFEESFDRYGDRVIKGNTLMINQGDGTFRDVPDENGTSPFGWYWGSTMFDYDNDGWQDIYAANGWVSGPTKDDL